MSYRGIQSTNSDEEGIDWSHLSQTVASNIQKISQNVNQIQRMINQMETSEDLDSLRTQLHLMQDSTNQLTRDTNISLKELSELPQMVQSLSSMDRNRRNALINSLNASNIRKSDFLTENNNTKQFSVEKFMSPSTLVPKKSNFYEGKTVFGGANTSRAARLAGTTPYNLLQRHHLAPVLRVNVETSKRLVETNVTLSSSSQRILEKLEKASTPLQDARRIPSSAHLKNYFQTSDLLHRSNKRPKLGATPVFSQTAIEQSFQPKHWELKLFNKEDNNVSTNESTKQLTNSCDNKYLIDSNESKSNETFGGKIMRKNNKKEEKRPQNQTTNGGQNDCLDLLTNVKPLKMPSNLPKFNFGSKSLVKPKITTLVTKVNETQGNKFKFSEPLLKTKDQKSDTILSDKSDVKNSDKPFVFSSPLSAITHISSNDSQKFGNEFNILKQTLQKSDKIVTENSKQSSGVQKSKNKIEIKRVETNTEKWICVCLYPNISSDNRCKACNKERISQTKQSAPSLTSSKTNTTVELNTRSTPIAQNTTIGWGNKFKPPSGSWSCSVCLVNNSEDKTKCMACEEPKPGANNTDNNTTESSKSSSELWQCFYCKHNNEISKTVCSSCAKIKTSIATKADLDKLYGGQTFKFGITEEKNTLKKDISGDKPIDGSTDIFSKAIKNTLFSKSNESTPQTSTSFTNSNAFVFGTSSNEDKHKLVSDSIKHNDKSDIKPEQTKGTVESLFKFGAPPPTPKTTIEKLNTNIGDIFGSNKSGNSSATFNFGSVPTTTSATQETTVSTTKSNTDSSLFVFGVQNKEDLSKNKKSVSFDLEKNKTSSETTNNISNDSKTISFQIPKSSEDKQQMFKAFNSSTSGSLFGLTTSSPNTSLTTVTTSSITSFMDNKFTPLKSSETSNKSIGSLFGVPTTTTSSSPSFPSQFSVTNSSGFSSGQTSTTSSGQTNIEGNGAKSLFSLTPSSSVKSFDSLISNQSNPLSSGSTVTPTPPLNSSISSSPQKGLVFGNSNPNLQSFSSQSSTATTKPNFSFNLGANTSAMTAATPTTTNTFGGNNNLFGSNSNKGFTFGNSAQNNSQTPAFSFTIPSTNSLTNSSNISFGLNSNAINTTSADTNNKPAVNQLFAFGVQNSDQISSSSAHKTLNNTNLKTSSQFSFGLSSNPSTGQTNNTNLFANAINPAQNSLSFNQLAPTATPVSNSSPFTFGGFGTTPSAPSMQQMQSRSQPPLPPPQFNFTTQPSFDFTSMTNTGANNTTAGPVFQFSAEQTSQTVASNRNIKKAKRRLPNPT